jgi:hypothetical protein
MTHKYLFLLDVQSQLLFPLEIQICNLLSDHLHSYLSKMHQLNSPHGSVNPLLFSSIVQISQSSFLLLPDQQFVIVVSGDREIRLAHFCPEDPVAEEGDLRDGLIRELVRFHAYFHLWVDLSHQ